MTDDRQLDLLADVEDAALAPTLPVEPWHVRPLPIRKPPNLTTLLDALEIANGRAPVARGTRFWTACPSHGTDRSVRLALWLLGSRGFPAAIGVNCADGCPPRRIVDALHLPYAVLIGDPA